MAKTRLQEYGEFIIVSNLIFDQHMYRATKAILDKYSNDLPPLLKAELEKCVDEIECQKQESLEKYIESNMM